MLSMGLGLAERASKGGSAFNPSSLTLRAWWDTSDSTKVFQTIDTSTPAALGNPIGRISDKGPNAVPLLQATAGLRPTRQATGADFDGTDDLLTTASGLTWASPSDMWFVVKADANPYILAWDTTNAAAEAAGIANPTDGTAINVGIGTPTVRVNNVLVTDTRDAFATAMGTSTVRIVEIRNATMAFSQFAIGNYGGAFIFNGQYGEIIIAAALDAAQRASLYSYLAAKWSVP